jgi:phage terminase small subunit
MGGRGSGSFPDDGSVHGVGRPKKSAVAVAGSGSPVKPDWLPDECEKLWQDIADVVQGVAFEQDSIAIAMMAELLERYHALARVVRSDKSDHDSLRSWLAVGRPLKILMGDFGMTPRSRQILLVPKEDEDKDPFDAMFDGRDAEG